MPRDNSIGFLRSRFVSSNDGAGSAYVKELSLSLTGCVLLSVFGYNKGAQAWLQIHASTGTPVANRVPEHSFGIAALDNFSMIIPATGLPLDKCHLAVSTTGDKFTAAATNDVTLCATLSL